MPMSALAQTVMKTSYKVLVYNLLKQIGLHPFGMQPSSSLTELGSNYLKSERML
jgi:hypothetical protein